jgi:hypothetical protein
MKDLWQYLVNCSAAELICSAIIAAIVIRWVFEIITDK